MKRWFQVLCLSSLLACGVLANEVELVRFSEQIQVAQCLTPVPVETR